MKKIIYIFLILSAYILNSCCDCSVNPVSNPAFDCLIRESTITEFNAELVKVDTVLNPGPYYSIHNFVFPENKYLTGTLVNDERFALTGEVIVAQQSYSDGKPYKIAILDNNPINSNMIGDMLVDTVYSADTTADLKFKGELTRLDSSFLFDDAELFCDYIKFNETFIKDNVPNLSEYGRNVRGSGVPKTFSNSDIRILNSDNENVTGQAGVPAPSNENIADLLLKVNSENVVIRVKLGDIFLYKSIAGDLFVVLVSDIGNGVLAPNKGRVTIMFQKIS